MTVAAFMVGSMKQHGVLHRMVWDAAADKPVAITRKPWLLVYTAIQHNQTAVCSCVCTSSSTCHPLCVHPHMHIPGCPAAAAVCWWHGARVLHDTACVVGMHQCHNL